MSLPRLEHPRVNASMLRSIERDLAERGEVTESDVEMLCAWVRALREENQGLLAENAKLRGEAVESINHMLEETPR